jgi:hypothetical protein
LILQNVYVELRVTPYGITYYSLILYKIENLI